MGLLGARLGWDRALRAAALPRLRHSHRTAAPAGWPPLVRQYHQLDARTADGSRHRQFLVDDQAVDCAQRAVRPRTARLPASRLVRGPR